MAIVEDFTCTHCSVCDDLRLTVEGDRIVRAERACALAEP
jgi:formylmethanofuran dehydrogenase subunit B